MAEIATLERTRPYSFKDCLARSERINWRVEDLIGGEKRLDFSKAFMPEGLARVEALSFLTPQERLKLNQIRGHAYLALFGIVEEFILPFLMDHARPHLLGESTRARAFLEFAAEEAKHIHLFRCFRDAFREGFGTECGVIGPAADIGAHVLSHNPLSVALLILHIEWMTQRHFTESVEEAGELDPRFKDLLLHHWMEERQHAQLDTLMVESLADGLAANEVQDAIDGYIELGGFLDGGLRQQTKLDLDALEQAMGRTLSSADREVFIAQQHQANRWTYIGSGMRHPNFQATLGKLSPRMRDVIAGAAPTFS
jgi:hypothetical protein